MSITLVHMHLKLKIVDNFFLFFKAKNEKYQRHKHSLLLVWQVSWDKDYCDLDLWRTDPKYNTRRTFLKRTSTYPMIMCQVNSPGLGLNSRPSNPKSCTLPLSYDDPTKKFNILRSHSIKLFCWVLSSFSTAFQFMYSRQIPTQY